LGNSPFLFDAKVSSILRYRESAIYEGMITMESFQNKVNEATNFVRSRIKHKPYIGLVMGTGLGEGVDSIKEAVSVDYRDVPGFPVSTVAGHRGRLISGHLKGKPVLAMQGRFHYYEGYSMKEVTFPIRVMQLLGVKTLIVSNASGGIHPLFVPGDIMIITDHINLTGGNPLIGPNVDDWGPRFPDMTQVYDRGLMAMAEAAALENGIRVQKGVYVGLAGPSLETRAEIRFLKTIGADAVGLSTIPEVIAAVHAGMAILGLSVITNMNLPDNPKPCQVGEVIATAERAAPRLQAIIEGVTEKLPAPAC
jgi:purine-nucleoside phosphorylase